MTDTADATTFLDLHQVDEGTFLVAGDPRSLTPLATNARYLRHETFNRLVENVRRDGRLESAPLVYLHQGREEYDELPAGTREILSGNHRTKAAIEAGLERIVWLELRMPLTKQERIARQLSQNAIAGEDDPAVLKQLYEQLNDLGVREYSGLDDKTLQLLDEVKVGNLAEANLEFQTLSITFLPAEMERAKASFAEARAQLGQCDERWVARYDDHDRILEALAKAGGAHDIKNVGASLALILDVFDAHVTDLEAGWYDEESDDAKHGGRVPLATLFGFDDVPTSAALTIRRAIEKLIKSGDVEPSRRINALELLAADYLAGA